MWYKINKLSYEQLLQAKREMESNIDRFISCGFEEKQLVLIEKELDKREDEIDGGRKQRKLFT